MKILSDLRLIAGLGAALELNPLGEKKICSMDCKYCGLGPSEAKMTKVKDNRSYPSRETLTAAVSSAFSHFQVEAAGIKHSGICAVSTLLIAGNGEPTLHPEFGLLLRDLTKLRESLIKDLKIVVQTNGLNLNERHIVDALNLADETVVKLDVATEKQFKTLNAPLVRGYLDRIIFGAKNLENLSLQMVVFGGAQGQMLKGSMDEWFEIANILQPKRIFLHAFQNQAGTSSQFESPTEDELHGWSHWIERKLKMKPVIDSTVSWQGPGEASVIRVEKA